MVCETRLRPRQTLEQRKLEVREVVQKIAQGLSNGSIKAKIDPKTGAIAFAGLTAEQRNDVTDACVYRSILTLGNGAALMKIQAAEMAAGRSVNKAALYAGVHSHDGGGTWHGGH